VLISPTPDLALAFANTRYWRGNPQPTDDLADWPALLDWLARNVALDEAAARGLRASSQGEACFAAAIALRESLYRLFAAVAAKTKPLSSDVAMLRAALAVAPMRRDLVHDGNFYAWRIATPEPAAPSLLAPLLWSAGDLLTGAAAKRLRLCDNDKCLYLFIDNSRAGARRWCNMKACGNRAKAHRHYRKSRATE
jgi:predicted RNA-binding Zn ribbon-like protein